MLKNDEFQKLMDEAENGRENMVGKTWENPENNVRNKKGAIGP